MTNHPPLNPDAFDLACKELFLTVTSHKSAADVLGFDWKSLKASTRKPWETATRKVLTAYLEADGTVEELHEINTRLARILTDTANALKGEPDPLTSHSWHDLAEVAKRKAKTMPNTPLNPDARTECVDMLLEIMGYPRDELFEYPNRADDSREYIARAERTLDKILTVAQPELQTNSKSEQALEFVKTVEELDALPVGSVLLDRIGRVWEIQGVGQFFTTGSSEEAESYNVNLPAQALYSKGKS